MIAIHNFLTAMGIVEVIVQIFLTIFFIFGFVYVLKYPVLYKPRQDAGDVVRWVFYGVIQLIITVGAIVAVWIVL